jgi:hypothetical protein
MPSPGTYSARSPADLAKLSQAEGGLRVIGQLEDKQIKSSASGWSRRHLVAYRLLIEPKSVVLKALKAEHETECPICKPEALCPQSIDKDATEVFAAKYWAKDLL